MDCGLGDGFLEFGRVVADGGDCTGEAGDGTLPRRLAEPARGAEHRRRLAFQAAELLFPGGQRRLKRRAGRCDRRWFAHGYEYAQRGESCQ